LRYEILRNGVLKISRDPSSSERNWNSGDLSVNTVSVTGTFYSFGRRNITPREKAGLKVTYDTRSKEVKAGRGRKQDTS